jgi:hypothetical protein
MTKINIDEQLAAKTDMKKDPIEMVFRKKKWTFSPSMPAQMPELFGEGKIVQALLLCLNARQRKQFEELGVTLDEVSVIVTELAKLYGAEEGESEASE